MWRDTACNEISNGAASSDTSSALLAEPQQDGAPHRIGQGEEDAVQQRLLGIRLLLDGAQGGTVMGAYYQQYSLIVNRSMLMVGA